MAARPSSIHAQGATRCARRRVNRHGMHECGESGGPIKAWKQTRDDWRRASSEEAGRVTARPIPAIDRDLGSLFDFTTCTPTHTPPIQHVQVFRSQVRRRHFPPVTPHPFHHRPSALCPAIGRRNTCCRQGSSDQGVQDLPMGTLPLGLVLHWETLC